MKSEQNLNSLFSDTEEAESRTARIDQDLAKRLLTFLLPSVFLLASLYIFLLAPLYVRFSNDVLYMESAFGGLLVEGLNILCALSEILIFGIAFGTILYSMHRLPARYVRTLLFVYGGVILYKNYGNLVIGYLTDGFPDADTRLFDFATTSAYILLEVLQATIALLIARKILRLAKEREEIRKNAAQKLSRKAYTPIAYFPIRRIFDNQNPIQKAALSMALVTLTFKVVSRIFYDVVVYTLILGNPFVSGLSDALTMLLYYSADVLGSGIIVYFAVLFLLMRFYDLDEKLKSKVEEKASEN